MKTHTTGIVWAGATILLAAVGLVGCSSGSGTASGSSVSSPAPSASGAGKPEVGVAASGFGQIVVDGTGMTAYYYDKDVPNSGSSTCTGQCATNWPAIHAASATPVVSGVTGTVGTITGVDGKLQITVNGRPIYTFASDKAPGDVRGQGVGSVWYVISPSGEELKAAAPASPTSAY